MISTKYASINIHPNLRHLVPFVGAAEVQEVVVVGPTIVIPVMCFWKWG